jgi:hypothetical protein
MFEKQAIILIALLVIVYNEIIVYINKISKKI